MVEVERTAVQKIEPIETSIEENYKAKVKNNETLEATNYEAYDEPD